MSEAETPADRREKAITEGLRVAGLAEGDRDLVEFYLDAEDEEWRECCGSSCFPCTIQLAQAVDAARAELRRTA